MVIYMYLACPEHNLYEGFFLSSVEYRVKIVAYRVNLVEY